MEHLLVEGGAKRLHRNVRDPRLFHQGLRARFCSLRNAATLARLLPIPDHGNLPASVSMTRPCPPEVVAS